MALFVLDYIGTKKEKIRRPIAVLCNFANAEHSLKQKFISETSAENAEIIGEIQYSPTGSCRAELQGFSSEKTENKEFIEADTAKEAIETIKQENGFDSIYVKSMVLAGFEKRR